MSKLTSALDYPPFFAWFSYVLALPAKLLPSKVSESILRLSATPVETWQTVGYMRTTVLITELCLLFGCLRYLNLNWTTDVSLARRSSGISVMAVFYHPGFLILDNIHFQYNAFLFGLMLWSFIGAYKASLINA
jgi:alpha-1,3-glucosyltransferase